MPRGKLLSPWRNFRQFTGTRSKTVTLNPEAEAELLAAMAEGDRGEVVSAEEFFEDLGQDDWLVRWRGSQRPGGELTMANHKRRRPKNRRAGCLLCKPWKVNGFAHRSRSDGQRFSDYRRMKAAQEQLQSQRGEP